MERTQKKILYPTQRFSVFLFESSEHFTRIQYTRKHTHTHTQVHERAQRFPKMYTTVMCKIQNSGSCFKKKN